MNFKLTALRVCALVMVDSRCALKVCWRIGIHLLEVCWEIYASVDGLYIDSESPVV